MKSPANLAALIILCAFALSLACRSDASDNSALGSVGTDAQAMESVIGAESACPEDAKSPVKVDPIEEMKTLWDMTEARKTPLDVEIVSRRSENGFIVEELYFTSEVTPNGPNRIFCAFARPENPKQPVPLLLQIHGGGGHGDAGQSLWAARQLECASISIDWSGEFIPGAARYTIWRCDPPNPYDGHFAMAGGLKGSSVYRIVLACRRVLDYACERPDVDSTRVGAMGGSWGGLLSALLAGVDDRVTTIACAFGAGNASKTRGILASLMRSVSEENRDLWIRAFDPAVYIGRAKASTMVIASTNDSYFWLEDVLGYHDLLRGEKNLMIVPNSNHNIGGPRLADSLWVRWMRQSFHEKHRLPRVTELKCGGRRYTWKTQDAPAARASLYWSPGEVVSPARYWLELPASRDGDLWTVDLPEHLAGLSGRVYAVVFDSEDGAVSSVLIHRKGADPFTFRQPVWTDGRLWDEERGTAAWRPVAMPGVPGSLTFNLESGCDGGITVGPAAGEKHFAVLTNSVILAAARVCDYKGIRLVIDGRGQAETITVSLHRNWASTDETTYSAVVNYTDSLKTVDLPWDAFKSPAGPPDTFDTLRLDGSRSDESSLRIESLRLY